MSGQPFVDEKKQPTQADLKEKVGRPLHKVEELLKIKIST